MHYDYDYPLIFAKTKNKNRMPTVHSKGIEQDVYRFDPKIQLPKYGILVFSGMTGSGKSVCMQDVMYYYRNKLDMVIAFVGSEETADELQKHIPRLWIHDTWKPEVLEKEYKTQEIRRKIYGRKGVWYIGVFIDDFSYLKKSLFTAQIMVRIAYNCRHARLIVLISTQYCKDSPTYIRDNTKQVFVGFNKDPEKRRKIYEAYNPGFDNFQDYDKTMVQLTKDYEMMVCNISEGHSYDIADNVFYHKAKPNRNYRINKHGKIWRIQDQYYDDQYYLKAIEDENKRHLIEEANNDRRARKRMPGTLMIRKHKRTKTATDNGFYFMS